MGGGKALATDYYLRGSFDSSWNINESCKFTETSTSGVYELKYLSSFKNVEFKIYESSTNAWYGGSGDYSNLNTEYSLTGGSNIKFTADASHLLFKLDTRNSDSPKLTITNLTGYECTLYLAGSFNGSNNYTSTKFKFYATDTENVYKCSYYGTFSTEWEFKVLNDKGLSQATVTDENGVSVGSASSGTTLATGTVLTCSNYKNTNPIKLSQAITNPVFTLDVTDGNNPKLSVEQGDFVYNIHGNFYDSDWKVGYKMAQDLDDSNKWVTTLVPTNNVSGNYEFGIQVLIGGVQPGNNGWISCNTTVSEFSNNNGTSWTGNVYTTENQNISLAKGIAKDEALTFTYDTSASTLTISKASTYYYPLPTSDKYFYTLYLSFDAYVPKGLQIYQGSVNSDQTQFMASYVSGSKEGDFTTEDKSYYIPKYTPVLLKRNPSSYTEGREETFKFYVKPSTDTSTQIINNSTTSLLGVLEDTKVTDLAGTGKVVLCMGVGETSGTVGFRRPRNNTIYANDAYIVVEESSDTAGSKFVSIVLEDETTGINDTVSKIESSDTRSFNIAGQQVIGNYKGLVIKNGKKYLIK